jgi:hypothetical protein
MVLNYPVSEVVGTTRESTDIYDIYILNKPINTYVNLIELTPDWF